MSGKRHKMPNLHRPESEIVSQTDHEAATNHTAAAQARIAELEDENARLRGRVVATDLWAGHMSRRHLLAMRSARLVWITGGLVAGALGALAVMILMATWQAGGIGG